MTDIERRLATPPPFTWADMDKHIDDKLKPVHEKLDELKTMMTSAVPDGDFDGHRKAHEHWLEEVSERKAMWSKVRASLLEKSIWTLIGALVIGAWYWLKGNLK
jgi:hypothetical protein